jgi:hypothetical protein
MMLGFCCACAAVPKLAVATINSTSVIAAIRLIRRVLHLAPLTSG